MAKDLELIAAYAHRTLGWSASKTARVLNRDRKTILAARSRAGRRDERAAEASRSRAALAERFAEN